MDGNYAYVSTGLSGLIIYDVSNPSNIIQLGNYDPGTIAADGPAHGNALTKAAGEIIPAVGGERATYLRYWIACCGGDGVIRDDDGCGEVRRDILHRYPVGGGGGGGGGD